MHPQIERLRNITRRTFLHDSKVGLGSIALASLLSKDGFASSTVVNPLAPKAPQFAAKAKRVIYLHLSGAPPHFDLFDYKPELVKRTGQNVPDKFLKGRKFAFTTGVPKLL